MIMTLMEGAPLHRILQMNGKFEEKVVQLIIRQLIELIGYLHNLGVLYRDLKASNLLLDKNGALKLIDFGLAKKIDQGR